MARVYVLNQFVICYDEGGLTCADCDFWVHHDTDGEYVAGYCCATGTREDEEDGFDRYEGRMGDCPLGEVKA